MARYVSSLVAISVAVAVVSAQKGGGRAAIVTPTFEAGVDLVMLDVSVNDERQLPLSGLTRDDFVVVEDGVPQSLAFLATQQVPLDVALVLDTSASMSAELPIVERSATAFVKALPAGARATVVELSDHVNILQPLTANLPDVNAGIQHLEAGGMTALYDGLYVVIQQFGARPAPEEEVRSRAMIILSDGMDTASLLSSEHVLEQARREDVTIDVMLLKGKRAALGLTRQQELHALDAINVLAEETGGQVFPISAMRDLDPVYEAIAAQLGNRYTLGYVSANPRHAGTFHRLVVGVKERPDVRVRARSGYYAAR